MVFCVSLEYFLFKTFPLINIDLIAGMVGETTENWKDCIKKTIEIAPDCITIYHFCCLSQPGKHGEVHPMNGTDNKTQQKRKTKGTVSADLNNKIRRTILRNAGHILKQHILDLWGVRVCVLQLICGCPTWV